MADPTYKLITNRVCNISEGYAPSDWQRILNNYAMRLKHTYGVEPVDIVAALCLFQKGRSSYGFILLKRACRDLRRIGEERGWL